MATLTHYTDRIGTHPHCGNAAPAGSLLSENQQAVTCPRCLRSYDIKYAMTRERQRAAERLAKALAALDAAHYEAAAAQAALESVESNEQRVAELIKKK